MYYLYSLREEIGYVFRGGKKYRKGKTIGTKTRTRTTIRGTRIAAGTNRITAVFFYVIRLNQTYKIKSNVIKRTYYVIFITEIGLLTFARFHLKFPFRAYYTFIYTPDLFSNKVLLALSFILDDYARDLIRFRDHLETIVRVYQFQC